VNSITMNDTTIASSPSSLGVTGGLVVLGLGIYGIVDSVVFGVATAQRVAYGLVWLATMLAVFLAMGRARYSSRVWRSLANWLLVVTLFLVPGVGQYPYYPAYVAGDAATLMLPALILMVGLAVPGLFGRVALAAIGVALASGMAVAPLIGVISDRFETPAALLVAIAFWLFAVQRGRVAKIVGLILIAGTLALSVASGQRTSVVIWIAMFGCAVLVRYRTRGVLVAVACLLVVAFGPIRGSVMPVLQSSLHTTRFSTVVEGESDESLLARIREGADVVGTLRREGNVTTWVIGFGHGATYRPRLSFLARNVTSDGRVHNIHIGPIMLVYRYGAVGLISMLIVAVVAAATLVRPIGVQKGSPSATAVLFAMGAVAYLIKALMFNVLIDPFFSYSLAGLLFHSVRWREEPTVVSGSSRSIVARLQG
jgi:hypothetical protein